MGAPRSTDMNSLCYLQSILLRDLAGVFLMIESHPAPPSMFNAPMMVILSRQSRNQTGLLAGAPENQSGYEQVEDSL